MLTPVIFLGFPLSYRDRFYGNFWSLARDLAYGTEPLRTHVKAITALDTLALVDDVHHPLAASYRLHRAVPQANATPLALVGKNAV